MPNLSRAELVRDADSEPRTTTLELFYDLVFVFAITQVSHLLLDNLTWQGAGQAALILLVVWWSWNYTTWVTNELDPDSVLVRLLLIVLMLASLLMAIAIPDASSSAPNNAGSASMNSVAPLPHASQSTVSGADLVMRAVTGPLRVRLVRHIAPSAAS
jgi:hypothetical protein